MNKRVINTDQAPAAIGPYSQAIEINNFGFTSGQIPLDLSGNIISDNFGRVLTDLIKYAKILRF